MRTIGESDLTQEQELIAMQTESLEEPPQLDAWARDVKQHVVGATVKCLKDLGLNTFGFIDDYQERLNHASHDDLRRELIRQW